MTAKIQKLEPHKSVAVIDGKIQNPIRSTSGYEVGR